jgi:ABC-type Fe2+-enterobactin transport system substrate-binding protein
LAAVALAADLGAVNDPQTGTRYNFACAAALAGCGRGIDAPAGEADRARLRSQALAWLRADLALRAKVIRSGAPAAVADMKGVLRHWREDADLADVRDRDALEKLPDAERAEWRKLWAEADVLLQPADDGK